MDISDRIAKQDLFSLSTNTSICIPKVKDLSIFIPKNDMSEVLQFIYLNIQLGYLNFYYFYFETV
jgi:hypothetical protein